MSSSPIPFVDLRAQYLSIQDEIDAAIASVIRETSFIRGPHVAVFEESYANACGRRHCIGVANGTDAIYIALKMLGVGPGDEVVTAANSWIASSETITQTGATPVFLDVESDFFNMDPERLKAAMTPRTKAVVAVHLFGQPAQIDAIKSLCDEHGAHLVEDCAQAHFSEFEGRQVGGFGAAATYSFYPGKNLGAYGDAGAIVTDDDDLAARMRSFARHGASPKDKHDHIMEGVNSRLDGIQAAVLNVKLPRAKEWNARRAEKAERYLELLADVEELTLPKTRPNATHVWHVFSVRTPRRDEIRRRLSDAGIHTGIHYPTPLPLLAAYERLGHRPEDFPIASRNSAEFLSLPMYPELTDDAQARVASCLKEALAG